MRELTPHTKAGCFLPRAVRGKTDEGADTTHESRVFSAEGRKNQLRREPRLCFSRQPEL